MKLGNISKILFITLSNIGDAILTLPVLSALKENFPRAEIHVVSGPRPEGIFKKDPRVKRVFVYNKRAGLKEKMSFISELKKEKYGLAIDMKTSLIPMLVGARYRSGLFAQRRQGLKHKKMIHMDVLAPFEIKGIKNKNIYIDENSRQSIRKILSDSGVKESDFIIGISPGSRSPLKQWKKDGFVEVIKNILKEPGKKVVLIGDEAEKMLSREIAEAVKLPGLIDLTGKTSINELFALIEKFNLFLTGDNASMHIASDLGVKTIAIFGPTDPEEYGPTGKSDVVIRKGLKCSPCKKAQCRLGTHECMTSISVEEVLSAVRKSL